MQKISLALTLLLLTGCAHYDYDWSRGASSYNDSYVTSDFDELLGFGANMAQISPTSRTEVCQTLVKSKNGGPGVQLHLLLGRLHSDSCGDINKILDSVRAIHITDERMQKLVTIHTEALKRLNNQSRKLGSFERKQKTVQSVLESKDPPVSGSKKDENRLLREKLEAIRAMEKQLDESGDAK
jgi:hypothetical protein